MYYMDILKLNILYVIFICNIQHMNFTVVSGYRRTVAESKVRRVSRRFYHFATTVSVPVSEPLAR